MNREPTRIRVVIEYAGENYGAYSSDLLPGCVATGDTREEVEANMSGHKKFRDLARPIYDDPVRRARVERLHLIQDEWLARVAAADAELSDEELEELYEQAKAQIERNEVHSDVD